MRKLPVASRLPNTFSHVTLRLALFAEGFENTYCLTVRAILHRLICVRWNPAPIWGLALLTRCSASLENRDAVLACRQL
jgi:hypothetical protein